MAGRQILVWQWGRFGAGPRFAAELAQALEACGERPVLSLSQQAESFASLSRMCECGFRFSGGAGLAGIAWHTLLLPLTALRLARYLERDRPDYAICAMPGYWDPVVAWLLHRLDIPLVTIIHEMEAHPGDRHAVVYHLQRRVTARSALVVTLSKHVAELAGAVRCKNSIEAPQIVLFHPPFGFADLALPPPVPPQPVLKGEPLRLLVAGRLREYKAVETALDVARRLGPGIVTLRVAGATKGHPFWRDEARAMANVQLRLEWLSERDLVSEIDAADVVLFPYAEASQSGLLPICQSRGKVVVTTPLSGLAEQVNDGIDGFVAKSPTAESIVDVVKRITDEPAILRTIGVTALNRHDPAESWYRFADELMKAVAA
ncbi:MAG: glycosyltransferase family 4 protein [Notoacmeibacter sp.]|nr:glycosyltransferase family 4 protein [Notoacmeibacter sp.]